MVSEFTVEIKIDITIPNFEDASIPLQQIGEEIAEDARKNIRLQRSPNGKSFFPLSKRTIDRKGFSAALIDKGIMLGAIHAYKVKNNTVVVGVIARGKPSRDLVALIHQEQGVPSKKGRIARPFLGISEKRAKWIEARMKRWVAERIQKSSTEAGNHLKFKY